MKRILLLSASLFGSILISQAQDLITTRNGEDIEAKVLEVSSKEIKYKRFNNLNGPTFTLDVRDVVMVRYENGDKDIFEHEGQYLNASGEIHEGMRYREYKNLYDARFYIHDVSDAYRPGLAGLASFFIPGLGQCVDGELGRGLGIFAADIGLSVLFWGSVAVLNANYEETGEMTDGGIAAEVAVGALLGQLVLDIWSICDAAHVAKIKNMYQQDLRSQRAALDIKLEPFFASTPVPSSGGFSPSAGFSLKVNF